MDINVAAKYQEQLLKKEAKAKKKARKRRERKCFWTRPFGHAYKKIERPFRFDYVCVGCGKNLEDPGPY